ncbi:MAG: pilus assembly protein [Devosia sp.]|nr:pilus assembly protein [Devosia sp.]
MRALRLQRLKALGRDERGATAIELALLALPFFALTGAIIETSIVFLASQVLDAAVQDSSRLIRTGQAQTNSYTIDTFRTAICSELFNLFNCSNLQIKVSVVSNFASATTPASPLDPVDPSKWTLVPAFDPGTGSQVIMVQVYYKWPVMLRIGGLNLATSSDGTRLMSAVRVFANEPFSS